MKDHYCALGSHGPSPEHPLLTLESLEAADVHHLEPLEKEAVDEGLALCKAVSKSTTSAASGFPPGVWTPALCYPAAAP